MKSVSAAAMFIAANAVEVPLTNLQLTWKDCGGAAKISKVEPTMIPLGTSTKITGSGTSPVTVSGGNFAATVKAGWIPLASCSGPIGPAKTCTLPLGAGSLTLNAVPLPIHAGPAAISLTVNLAASLPAQLASTTTHATATSTSGQGLVCLDIYLKDGLVDAIPDVSGGACSAADQAKITARGGGDSDGHFPMDNEECARANLNLFKGIDPAGFDSCLVGKVGISSSCANCYWQSSQYGFENCKWSCLTSWCSSGCLSCTKAGGDKANACAGFTSTSVPTPCDAEGVVV